MEEKLTNGVLVDKVQSSSIGDAARYLVENVNDTNLSFETICSNVTRVYNKYKQLNKSKSRKIGKENYECFMKAKYIVPATKAAISPKPSTSHTPIFAPTDNQNIKRETYEHVAEALATELNVSREEKESVETSNVLLGETNKTLSTRLEETSVKLEKNRQDLKRTVHREAYWREKSIKLEQTATSGDTVNSEVFDNCEQIDTLKQDIKNKTKQIKDLNIEIDELNVKISDLESKSEAEFYDEDSHIYCLPLHLCVYELLDNHVSSEHVTNVIKSVLKLVNVIPNKLPSSSTVDNWSVERGLLARAQIAETRDANTTLHTDEASKYGNKWGAFATRNTEGEYLVLGLRDMATKSSQDTMDTFKEIISDIDTASKDETPAGKNILCNIKNTMSDRAATETKFNDLLATYRDEVLPEISDTYNSLNEESKLSMSHMNNFFCGLHTLVHMADVSQKALLEVEKSHFDGNIPIDNPAFTKPVQPGTVRLIFTTCKAFARRGDQKNGCHGPFKTFIKPFLEAHQMLALPIQPLKGNRFNILFTNAGHIYFMKSQMCKFLEKSGTMNGLLQSVLRDLSEPFFIAGCKALGLVSKLITTPLWRVIEDKNVSISMMNGRYVRLLEFLGDAANNVDQFILGKQVLYEDIPIKQDHIYDSLVEPADVDDHVVVIMSVILPALAQLIKLQYGDHLPGGRHELIDPVDTASVDKHNKFPERVFSYVDHILAAKPNIKILALEAHITFALNKTCEWLSGRSDAMALIEQSRREVKKEKERFRQREREIQEQRNEKQKEDFRKKEEQEKRRIEKLEKETNDMMFYGLWQSEEQVHNELSKIDSVKEKVESLKVQLRFRKDIFHQKSDSTSTYNFSKVLDGKRIQHSVEELKGNVLKLIGKAYEKPLTEETNILVDKRIRHLYIEPGGKSKWYTGLVISQVPGFPEWFNVVYTGDEAVYTAKLREQYAAGEVVILA